jgi:hypothetical protein
MSEDVTMRCQACRRDQPKLTQPKVRGKMFDAPEFAPIVLKLDRLKFSPRRDPAVDSFRPRTVKKTPRKPDQNKKQRLLQ